MQTKQEDAKKGCLLSCPFLKFSWGLQWEPHILSLATQHCYHCQSGQKRSLLPIIIRSKNPFLPDKNEISREGTYSALALKEEKRRIWSREYINTRGVCRYVHLHPQFFTFIAHQLKNYGHFYRVNLFFLATLFLLSVTLIVLHKTKQLCCDDNLELKFQHWFLAWCSLLSEKKLTENNLEMK